MSTLQEMIDGDTVKIRKDNTVDNVRLQNINTPESVSPIESLNTPRGEQASEFGKRILPEESPVEVTEHGTDKFGRKLGDVFREVNGEKINFGLVQLDQGFSSYFTKFGKHPDPKLHNQYKEFYSPYVQYQAGESQDPLTAEQFKEVSRLQENFTRVNNLFSEGEATQEELDTAMVELYKNPELVSRFRHQLHNWDREASYENDGGPLRNAYDVMLQDPARREEYNRAVRNNDLHVATRPEEDPSLMDTLKTSFKMFNFVSHSGDMGNLWRVKKFGDTEETISDKELLKDVPPAFHVKILEERDTGTVAGALMKKEQLLEDIQNQTVFDKAEWYEQLLTGGLAMLLDPLTLTGGAVVAKGAQGVAAATKAAGISSVINASVNGNRAWMASRTFQNTAKMATWAAAGGAEGTMVNLPRLAADHQYTAKDFYMDTMMDSAFGLGLGGLVEGVIKPVWKGAKTRKELRNSREMEARALEEAIEKEAKIKAGEEVPAETPELQVVEDKATDVDSNVKAQETVQDAFKVFDVERGQRFTPWEAITNVSPKGFKAASQALSDAYPRLEKGQSAMRYLLNQQVGLNNKNLSDVERALANKMNSTILHIAGKFPNGKVPKNINKAIQEITFRQQKFNKRNAMSDLLEGKTADPVGRLNEYINVLENLDVFKDVDVLPVSRQDFFEQQSDVLNRLGLDDDTAGLSRVLPKEVSFIKDVVELNNMAAKMKNDEFSILMEKMNGLLSARLEQLELGTLEKFADSTKSFGKSVKMTAPEIATQLKKEGLTPRTSEYSKRLRELRDGTGRVAVSEEVQKVGKVREQEVGFSRDKYDTDESYDSATTLIKDDLDQDLLPRAYNQTETIEAYKNPTADTLKVMEERLHGLAKKLGVLEIKGKAEWRAQTERLPKVKRALLKDKQAVIEKMVMRKDMNITVDVIRASDTIAKEAKAKAASKEIEKPIQPKKEVTMSEVNAEAKAQEVKDATSDILQKKQKLKREFQNILEEGETRRPSNEILKEMQKLLKEEAVITSKVEKNFTPLTEEDIDVAWILESDIKTVDLEEAAKTMTKLEDSTKQVVSTASQRVSDGLSEWVRTGGQKLLKLAMEPRGTLDNVGRLAAKWTKDIGTKFQEGELTSMQYFGANVTEIGRGHGGNVRRKATGGVIRQAEYLESAMQIIPNYTRAIEAYAGSKGKGAVGKMGAQQFAGADSPLVKQFNREVFMIQEMRRQGKPLPENLDKSIIDFVDDWDKYMDHAHNKLVENGIGGFTKERKVKHYIPHVWQDGKFRGAISKHGKDKVIRTLTKAYEQAMDAGTNPRPKQDAREMAENLIKEVMETDVNSPDLYMPTADSRAKHREDLDTTVELEGLSVLDLLDDEVAGLATKYSNRLAGWVGLSKSTDGMLTSLADIDAFKKNMIQEGIDKGVSTKKHEQFYDDVIDSMFGRPTQGGLQEELRQIKDLAALTKMGGLGTAQLIETGQVITRATINMFSNKKTVKKIFDMAGENVDNNNLMGEIQSISSITNDLEWLDRQSVHLDQEVLNEVGNTRKLSLWLADKATFGKYKATASRALGKISGYNAVRRFQTRVTQASFTVDVANHFKHGTGKMGNARMADVGLTDTLGKDADLEDVFKNLVEFDDNGFLKKLNVDKWPKAAKEKFQYAMVRDEAQQIQRTLVGEMPPWMNKPLMALAMQFRQMPIVAQNKSLGRSMAFADKEAVVGIMLNAAMSGMVRYSKFAALGLGVSAITGSEWKEPNGEQMDVTKYITQFGMYPDTYDFVLDSYKATEQGDVQGLLGQIPALSTAFDYYNATGLNDKKGQMDAAINLVPLQNTAAGDMTLAGLREIFGEE